MPPNIQNLKPMAKGTTLNPHGKPKGAISWKHLINKVLDGDLTITEAGEKKKLSKRSVLALELVKIALDPKSKPNERLKAMEIIFSKTEGSELKKILCDIIKK